MSQTQTQTKYASLNANLAELPIMKHFGETALTKKVDNFRKGEKNLFWFIKLGFFGAIAWATWTYILPPVFQALGQFAAIAATGIALVGLIMALPAILKGLRLFTRWLHKGVIKSDPFYQLELERGKLIENQTKFRLSKGAIANLRVEMESEAKKAQGDAESGQTRIIALKGKAEQIKAQMDKMVAEKGVDAKVEDEYVALASKLQTALADAQRMINKTEQAKTFVGKYGARGNIMKKLNQKLTMVETAMEIKIADFDATVEMLKKDYEFANKANAATTAAKSALGFTKGWELDYALDVVTSTIAADIAMTAGNLKDIETLTANYSLDSDELYANLEKVANKIQVGEDIIPQAKKYTNPEYSLTQDDEVKSGGFGNMFN